jgi:hypothetical protein
VLNTICATMKLCVMLANVLIACAGIMLLVDPLPTLEVLGSSPILRVWIGLMVLLNAVGAVILINKDMMRSHPPKTSQENDPEPPMFY